MRKPRSGFVLGKFMPFHLGHEMLMRFAYNFVDELYVIVDNIPKDRYIGKYIPSKYRIKWIQNTFPKAKVVYMSQIMPQDPSEHDDFRNVRQKGIKDLLGFVPDYFIGSEQYGFPLSNAVGCKYIPYDIARKNVNVCATDLRENFSKAYDYLSLEAKKDFTLKVCIFGPESTGKSTLTLELGKHFNTIAVPEYARYFLEANIQNSRSKGEEFQLKFEGMLEIAKGQIALVQNMVGDASKILFSDTDALVTTIWTKRLFEGKKDSELELLAKENKFDLYLLTYPDISFENDDVRYFPEEEDRMKFFNDCENALKEIGANYSVVKGKGGDRKMNAVKVVEEFLEKKFSYEKFCENFN